MTSTGKGSAVHFVSILLQWRCKRYHIMFPCY